MSLIAPCPPPPAKRLFPPSSRELAPSAEQPTPSWLWRGAAVTVFLVGLGVFSAVVFERFAGVG